MISQSSSAIRKNSVSEKHIPDFFLDSFTVPLSYKLAVAAFLDTGNEAANIQGVEKFRAVYNEGSIISEVGVQSHSISQGKTPDIVLSFWNNFMSSISDILKRFVYGILF